MQLTKELVYFGACNTSNELLSESMVSRLALQEWVRLAANIAFNILRFWPGVAHRGGLPRMQQHHRSIRG